MSAYAQCDAPVTEPSRVAPTKVRTRRAARALLYVAACGLRAGQPFVGSGCRRSASSSERRVAMAYALELHDELSFR